MFSQKDLNLIKKKKLIIVGRGTTARFVEKFDNSYFIIGFNIDKIFSRKVNFYFDNKKAKKLY